MGLSWDLLWGCCGNARLGKTFSPIFCISRIVWVSVTQVVDSVLILNALPVPMLRQVYFGGLWGVFFRVCFQ